MSDELKTCTWCGRECRVETFGPSEFIENPFSIWVCSNAEIFGGTCTHALAYMSEEDWQEEPRSDELIEAMARCIHAELSRANVMAYLDMPDTTPETLARALLPIIRAHLEPNERLINVGVGAILTSKERPAIISQHDALAIAFPAMLAASPIGDVG